MQPDAHPTNPSTSRSDPGWREFPTPDSVQRRKLWVGIFWAGIAAGLLFRLGLYLSTGWTVGDAMISFRFAEQFSLGHGLVFNVGERVSGNTSLLYTFILGIAGWCGASIPVVAHLFGVACDLVTVFIIRRILVEHSSLTSSAVRLGLPAAIFLFPLTFPYSVSGMETSLYITLIMLLAWRTLAGTDWKFYLVSAALMYCRPDSVVFLAATLVFLMLRTRRIPWRPGLILFGIGLTYLAFNYFYYGSVVPNTVLAKAVAYHESWRDNFHYLAVRFLRRDALTLIWLVAVGLVWVWRRKMPLVLLLGLMWAGFLIFLMNSPQLRAWYVIPLFYLSLLIFGVGLGAWFESRSGLDLLAAASAGTRPDLGSGGTATAPGAWRWAALPVLATVVYLAASIATLPPLFKQCRSVTYLMQYDHVEPGRWLRENTPPDARIFETALEIGYFSKRYTMDWPGLVTPAVWKMIKQNRNLSLFEIAEALKADYILVPGEGTTPAPSNFQHVRDFGAPESVSVPRFGREGYRLYKRL